MKTSIFSLIAQHPSFNLVALSQTLLKLLQFRRKPGAATGVAFVLRPRSQAILRFPSLGEACVGRISLKRFAAVSKSRAVPRIAKEGRTCMLLGAQLRPSTPLCRRSCYATPVLVIFTPDARTATRTVRSSALLASR